MEYNLEEETVDFKDLDQAPVMRSWGSLMDLRDIEEVEEPSEVEERDNDTLDQAPVMRSWGSLMDLQNGEEAKGIEPSAKDWRPKVDVPNSKVQEEENDKNSDQAPLIKSWRSRDGEKAERESSAKDKRPEMDLLDLKVKEEENDEKTDPALVRSSGSVKDLIQEKEQEVETDNIDMEKVDVLQTKSSTDSTKSEDKGAVEKKTIILQNTTRLWKPKLRRPTFVFVKQNVMPTLKEGELEPPTADTTKADNGPVNVTPRWKKDESRRPTANTTKADNGPVNITPRWKKDESRRPTANTTKADYGPVNRKRKMDNINIEERDGMPKTKDERGKRPKNMNERGGMPKKMDERGEMAKRRKITFEDFPPKWKRERQHSWNHALEITLADGRKTSKHAKRMEYNLEEETVDFKDLIKAPLIKSWRSRDGEKAERESSAKDKRPEMDLLDLKVKEEENDEKTDPALVRSSGSVKDLIQEKEQEVETDNIDMEKVDVLQTKSSTDSTKSEDKGAVEKKTIILQNTTRLWKPKLRRPTFVFVKQNVMPTLKEGELEPPTADTTKADNGPVNVTPRWKKDESRRPTANTTKADNGPVNITPRWKKDESRRPTANTTKADYGPVNRKRKMDNINIEERDGMPKTKDERGKRPKNMNERGGMPKKMDERGEMAKRRKITFEDFPPKWKRERQHSWNHAPRNHTGRWKKDKQACVNNGFFTWNKPTFQVRIEMRPERCYQQKWSQPKGRTRFRPY
ncbi:ankyrin repeat domain-containing protein 11-like [Xenopus laevis]|uniref:Ankyrin repeat domain-containing protein 11-like n=1 Tax=Xenopus laevis TaxID=8355 RepID=A0A8J1L7N3_XENLA|nr:ankyrin repeat domain-containing protein 11-like [Xenopus laevis]